jgi:hypothetical protein
MMFTACFSVGIASTTVKCQNKSAIKSNFRIRGVSSVSLLEERLFLNVSHARSRAIVCTFHGFDLCAPTMTLNTRSEP